MFTDNTALLAAASYGKFDNIQDLSEIRSKLIIEGLSKDQAKVFTDTYEILAHQPNTASGYSRTIVENIGAVLD